MEKTIQEKIKDIEKYICENFEELDMDDPIEEGYFKEYEDIKGAVEEDFLNFENTFDIKLPKDFKELYKYKNGSGYFSILQCSIDKRNVSFSLLSLDEMKRIKGFFQDRDALLTDYPDFFTSEDIKNMRDNRIKPYLFHKAWFPFASYCDCCYLMLDFDPDKEGQEGQIIFYIHDLDEIVYAAESIDALIEDVWKLLEDMFKEA